MRRCAGGLWVAVVLALLGGGFPPAWGTEPADVGIDERIGERVPLGAWRFRDEEGRPVTLAELADRPLVLTLVYFRCPGICSPLLEEVARVADLGRLVPGEDYRLVTISFDPKDTTEMAARRRASLLSSLDRRPVAPEAWRVLTGDEEAIAGITGAVGFRYVPDPNRVDFVHAATVVFLARDGTVARYLHGLRFNPPDLEMAVLDATEGRARSFMRQVERLCYSYDPEARRYVVRVNRITLAGTIVFIVAFVGWLLRSGRRGDAASRTTT